MLRMRQRSWVSRAYVFHLVGVAVDGLAEHRDVFLFVRGGELLAELGVVVECVLDGLHVVLFVLSGQVAVLFGLQLEPVWGRKENCTLKVTKFLNF